MNLQTFQKEFRQCKKLYFEISYMTCSALRLKYKAREEAFSKTVVLLSAHEH